MSDVSHQYGCGYSPPVRVWIFTRHNGYTSLSKSSPKISNLFPPLSFSDWGHY